MDSSSEYAVNGQSPYKPSMTTHIDSHLIFFLALGQAKPNPEGRQT